MLDGGAASALGSRPGMHPDIGWVNPNHDLFTSCNDMGRDLATGELSLPMPELG